MKLSELAAQLEDCAKIIAKSVQENGDRNVTIDPRLLKIKHKILPNGDVVIGVKDEAQ